MKRFSVLLFVVLAISVNFALRVPIRDYEDYATNDDSNDDVTEETGESVTALNQTEALSSPYCPQCTYDHKGNRLNKDCPASKPPKCEKGSLGKFIRQKRPLALLSFTFVFQF